MAPRVLSREPMSIRTQSAIVVALSIVVFVCVRAAQDPVAPTAWRSFEGTWTATGERKTLATGLERPAAIVDLSGAIVLSLDGGLARGFRGEVIGFDDGATEVVGRWVWTDNRGDRIFGAASGEPFDTGRRFTATITGGTGRYAGITGEFALTWQYVIATSDGAVQGRAIGMKGRYRRSGARP